VTLNVLMASSIVCRPFKIVSWSTSGKQCPLLNPLWSAKNAIVYRHSALEDGPKERNSWLPKKRKCGNEVTCRLLTCSTADYPAHLFISAPQKFLVVILNHHPIIAERAFLKAHQPGIHNLLALANPFPQSHRFLWKNTTQFCLWDNWTTTWTIKTRNAGLISTEQCRCVGCHARDTEKVHFGTLSHFMLYRRTVRTRYSWNKQEVIDTKRKMAKQHPHSTPDPARSITSWISHARSLLNSSLCSISRETPMFGGEGGERERE